MEPTGHENSKTTMDIYAKVKYNKPEELSSVVNAAFQLAAIGLLFQHAKPFESPDDAKTSMVYGFFVNSITCQMCIRDRWNLLLKVLSFFCTEFYTRKLSQYSV